MRHRRPPVSLQYHQSLLGQQDQGFAHRPAAHVHVRRELFLNQPVAQVNATRKDGLPDAVGNLVCEHTPASRANSKASVADVGHGQPLRVNNHGGGQQSTGDGGAGPVPWPGVLTRRDSG